MPGTAAFLFLEKEFVSSSVSMELLQSQMESYSQADDEKYLHGNFFDEEEMPTWTHFTVVEKKQTIFYSFLG